MDERPRSVRKTRLRRIAYLVFGALLMAPIALYTLLLATEAYSTRQASAALTQLENLKLGDPESSYDRAVSAFQTEAGVHVLTAGAFRCERLWGWIWMFNQELGDKLFYIANRAGLRWWRLTTSDSVEDGKLSRVSVGFMVVGRYEMLGTEWSLAPTHTSVYGQIPLTDVDRRTFLHWFHITSMPSGEGFGIDTTNQSTEKELRARRINRKCLLSFRGCDGLCELLPDAVPVLRDRESDWGGWTDVPRSACDL